MSGGECVYIKYRPPRMPLVILIITFFIYLCLPLLSTSSGLRGER